LLALGGLGLVVGVGLLAFMAVAGLSVYLAGKDQQKPPESKPVAAATDEKRSVATDEKRSVTTDEKRSVATDEKPTASPKPAPRRDNDPRAISPEQFEKLQAMIKPHPDEAKWEEIPWMTNLWEARKKAAAEGKPLFVWSAEADVLGCT
jgi:hypothetical protein